MSKLPNKTCDRCNTSKTIDSFNKNCKNRDGYLHQCKECVSKKVKKWREEYCKVSKAGTKDHVVPLSKGGTNYIDNIVPACVSCNSSKRDKFLSEWRNLTLTN